MTPFTYVKTFHFLLYSLIFATTKHVFGMERSKFKAAKKKGSTMPDETISLGNRRPEGTALGHGSTLYVSHFFYGGISAVDLKSGSMYDVVPDQPFNERGGAGLSFYKNHIFAGGGGPKTQVPGAKVYVYDSKTGEEIAACAPLVVTEDSFMNEVTIKDDKVYITDSGRPAIMVLDAKAALEGTCDVTSIPLPEVPDFVAPGPDLWGANGIEPYGDGLLVVTESAGSVWFIDLSDESVTEVLPKGSVENGDGLNVEDGKMYVTQNLKQQISIYSLSGGSGGESVVATKMGTLSSPNYRSPATSVLYKGSIYSVNARFADLGFPEPGENDVDTFEEEFDIAIVKNVFGGKC